MTTKVLIATAWWPSKSRWFGQYSSGVLGVVGDADTEIFITTSFADSKFESIVRSMYQAEQWAKKHGHTHILNLEADKVIGPGSLHTLLSLDKSVILFGRNEQKTGLEKLEYKRLIDGNFGWGAMLVKTEVLNSVSWKDGYRGDYISPDRAWFKRLIQLGIDVYLDHSTPVQTLEPASNEIQKSFNP